jgi:tetratricopeptide (TPR) repeat protein
LTFRTPSDPVLEHAPAEARRYFEEGYRAQMEQRLDDAIDLYQKSIGVQPTAEAYTFLGWALSAQSRLDEAIAHCHTAIALDPDFGNPYNDIGAYLIELGRLDEAIPWLEQAKRAPRYEPRHFPHLNLARIHILRNHLPAAIRELKAVIDIEPGHAGARAQVRELHRRLAMLN